MGKTQIGVIWLVGATLIGAGCGSRQSPSTTAVVGGGAHVPTEQSAVEDESATYSEGEPWEPEEADEDSDEADDSDRERDRRDVKMLSYEKAMALPVEVGDVTAEGGEAQLTGEEIARFMDEHLDEMYDECIEKELRRDNELGTVTIELAIRGKDGMVLGATIDPGRRRFKNCLENYLEDVRFPTFASPRMGARYRFHTD